MNSQIGSAIKILILRQSLSPQRVFHWIFLILSLVSCMAYGQGTQELFKVLLKGDVFGRNSADFVGRKNIRKVLPKGSEAQVLEVKKMPSGNYGLRLKVTEVSGERGRLTAKTGDDVWVYLNKNKPWLDLYNKDNVQIKDLENLQSSTDALAQKSAPPLRDPAVDRAVAKQDGEAFALQKYLQKQTTVPNTGGVVAAGAETEAETCAGTCPTPIANKSTKSLSEVIDSVLPSPVGQQKPPPVKPPSSIVPPVKKVLPAASANIPSVWRNRPEVLSYSGSTSVENMIASAIKNGRRTRPGGDCYRWVKHALCAPGKSFNLASGLPNCKQTSLIDQYSNPVTGSGIAINAMVDLPSQGFKNIKDTLNIAKPEDAPKGAILVYQHKNRSCSKWSASTSGGSCEAGHIEIKTDWGNKGYYVSDSKSTKPIIGSDQSDGASQNFQLVGVFVKP
ncbi:MAG: hypothetical protein ACOYOK_16215 [Pseudobdellovibrionaceae bacterium]